MFWLRLVLVFLAVWLVFGHRTNTESNLDSERQDQEEKNMKKLQKEICSMGLSYGVCKGHRSMWYYNILARQCEPFTYSNCGGNRNRFYTYEECSARCYFSSQ